MTAAQGGGGVGRMRSVLVTMTSQYIVTMTSFCVQRGGGGQKGQKIAVILKVCPLICTTTKWFFRKASYFPSAPTKLVGLFCRPMWGGASAVQIKIFFVCFAVNKCHIVEETQEIKAGTWSDDAVLSFSHNKQSNIIPNVMVVQSSISST